MAEKKKVLVVDDEESFTWLVKVNLERTGDYEVLPLAESTKIIETAKEFQPDIILLDIIMPGLDGGEVQGLLEKDDELKDIPVLIVSALASNEDESGEPVVKTGDDVILAKPIRTETLITAMEEKLAQA